MLEVTTTLTLTLLVTTARTLLSTCGNHPALILPDLDDLAEVVACFSSLYKAHLHPPTE